MPVPKVTLFIPCLVDQIYPEMGIATLHVLRHVGCEVEYDSRAACCGQAALNGGHFGKAASVAKAFVTSHAADEQTVLPSGSCTAMVRNSYAELFRNTHYERGAHACSAHTFELCQFLVKEGLHEKINGSFLGRVGLHVSCHSLRALGITDEPMRVLDRITGCQIVDVGPPVCCGFGGLFSAKFDAIASGMARTRLEMFLDKGLEIIVSNDPGCIMHLRKEAAFYNYSVRILHIAEFLVQVLNLPSTL
jgi:L-lactate dehydrogenase complex protein LldE